MCVNAYENAKIFLFHCILVEYHLELFHNFVYDYWNSPNYSKFCPRPDFSTVPSCFTNYSQVYDTLKYMLNGSVEVCKDCSGLLCEMIHSYWRGLENTCEDDSTNQKILLHFYPDIPPVVLLCVFDRLDGVSRFMYLCVSKYHNGGNI